MRDLKYIIIAIPSLEPRAILFNGLFNHSDMWLGARKSIPNCSLDSAGFCSVRDNEVTVWGASESLKKLLKREVKSRGMLDENIIYKTLNQTHIL